MYHHILQNRVDYCKTFLVISLELDISTPGIGPIFYTVKTFSTYRCNLLSRAKVQLISVEYALTWTSTVASYRCNMVKVNIETRHSTSQRLSS